MICPDNCGKCCGTVPLPKDVYERNKDRVVNPPTEIVEDDLGNVYLPTKNGLCVFLNKDKRCEIYEDRPEVCRQYGEIDDMPCPFYRKDGTKRSRQERRRILREITKKTDKTLKELREYVKVIEV